MLHRGPNVQESQIATDRTGNLYLPNSTTGAVGVYAPHCGALLKTIADPQGGDLDVAIDGSRIYALGFSHVSVCSMNGCPAAHRRLDPSARKRGRQPLRKRLGDLL